ncbi:MAG: hypothetical protein M3314_10010 [Actinomycetota bacterium]|nr:hypothetical protein [Actinomycetota bacterium]
MRRRSIWSLADQVVSSLTNLVVLVVVTRTAPLGEIGAFALAFSVYQLLLALTRPLNTDPLLISYSGETAEAQREAGRSASGGAVALGLLVGLVGVAAWGVVRGSPGRALLALAACSAIFLLQDAWRLLFITQGAPTKAVVNGVIALVALVPALFVTDQLFGATASSSVLAWAGATAVAALAGVPQARIWPRPDRALRWWKDTSHLGTPMLGENVVAMAGYLVAIASIAWVSGVPALGRLRAAQVAIAVSHPLILVAGIVVTAEGSRVLSTGRLRRLVALVGLGTAGFTLLVTLAWHLVPASLGRRVLGPSWAGARPLLLAAGLFALAVSLTTVVSAGLRAARAPRVALCARLVAAPLIVTAALLGARSGPGIAILAMAVVEVGCAGLMWIRFRRGARAEPAETLVVPA